MSTTTRLRFIPLALLLLVGLPGVVRAQPSEDFDQYHLRIDADWVYNYPSGTIKGQGDSVSIDFKQDLNLNSFSTFHGKVDWKFTRKNHLYISFIPMDVSRDNILTKTFVFRGQTFNAGATTHAELTSNATAVGYQYDVVRRKWGHLGLGLQMDLIDVSMAVSAQAQIVGPANVHQAAVSASDSVLAPIPVAGPEFRLYLAPRLFFDGDIKGMYFFGYGNFISTTESIGVALSKHFALKAGYQLGSRLIVNDKADRLGLRMTHQGATVGASLSF